MSAPALPPAWARRCLGAALRLIGHGAFLGELDDLFASHAARDGMTRARRWYFGQCLSAPVRLGLASIGAARDEVSSPSGIEKDSNMASFLNDLRLAVRRLRRRPGYASASVLTLGVGVAAVTLVYSIANWMLLRPVPGVARPAELVTMLLQDQGGRLPISHLDFVELQRRVPSAPGLAAYSSLNLHLATRPTEAPQRVAGELVSSNLFTTLGVPLAAGTPFTATNDFPAEGAVALVSYALAQRNWGSPGAAVGQRITVNGETFTVLGVTARGFQGPTLPGRAQVWLPAGAVPLIEHDAKALEQRDNQIWQVLVARPGPGSNARITAELERAVIDIRALSRVNSFMSISWHFRTHDGIGLSPLSREAVRHTIGVLMIAAILLLLLICANVTNLGLTRSLTLRHATAVQRVLGARLGRLVRERLAESLLIGVAGAAVGAAVSVGALGLVRGAGIAGVSLDFGAVPLEIGVFAFAAALGIGAGVLAGVLPAFAARHGHENGAFRVAAAHDTKSLRLRRGLVVTQVALSTVLLIGSGLLARTIWNLRSIDLGFAPAGLVAFKLDPERQGYDLAQTNDLIERLQEQLTVDPRVRAMGIADYPLFSPSYIPAVFQKPGTSDQSAYVVARTFRVSPSFFSTIGLELTGENFGADPSRWLRADSTAEQVGILNEAAARALFPSIAPRETVGRTAAPRGRPSFRVLAVIPDARLAEVEAAPLPYVFRPWAQAYPVKQFTVYLRTTGATPELMSALRGVVQRIDPTLPIYDLRTVASETAELFAEQQLVASLAISLGVVAVGLAALGLYALLAYLVLERRRELGIRAALGATPRQLTQKVVSGGLWMVAIGLALGLVAAGAASRYLTSRLYGVTALDPATYVLGAVILLLGGIAASGIPARRAARTEIVTALREE